MGFDIIFIENISRVLASLDESNRTANERALSLGADKKEIEIARCAYQEALAHVGMAFGLPQVEIIMPLAKKSQLLLEAHVFEP